MSVVTNRDRDCMACRLVSGAGLMGIGGYIGYYAGKRPTLLGKLAMSAFSLSFLILGVARCTASKPFDKGDRATIVK